MFSIGIFPDAGGGEPDAADAGDPVGLIDEERQALRWMTTVSTDRTFSRN
jgi:hypothetical protein